MIKSSGRIAFSCPAAELPSIESAVKDAWGESAILKSLVSLDTPGKATVQVVILADPDGQEICFVGDEAFRELSQVYSKTGLFLVSKDDQVDPEADKLLDAALAGDKSNEWFAKKGRAKVEEA